MLHGQYQYEKVKGIDQWSNLPGGLRYSLVPRLDKAYSFLNNLSTSFWSLKIS